MIVETVCPQCNAPLRVSESFLGTNGTCRKCSRKITLTDTRFPCPFCSKNIMFRRRAERSEANCNDCNVTLRLIFEESIEGNPVLIPKTLQQLATKKKEEEEKKRRAELQLSHSTPPAKEPIASSDPNIGIVTAGYACGAASLLIFPPGLGLAGVALGIIALAKGSTGHGIAIIALSTTCALLGISLGFAIATSAVQ